MIGSVGENGFEGNGTCTEGAMEAILMASPDLHTLVRARLTFPALFDDSVLRACC